MSQTNVPELLKCGKTLTICVSLQGQVTGAVQFECQSVKGHTGEHCNEQSIYRITWPETYNDPEEIEVN